LPTGIEELFVSEYYGASISYAFNVSMYPAGSKYDVTIWEAEIFYQNIGARVFSISIEGLQVQSNLDLIKDTGGRYVAKAYNYVAVVTDGTLNIVLTSSVNNAKVSGIQVLKQ